MSYPETPIHSSLVQFRPVLPQHPVPENPHCEIRSCIPIGKNRQNYTFLAHYAYFMWKALCMLTQE